MIQLQGMIMALTKTTVTLKPKEGTGNRNNTTLPFPTLYHRFLRFWYKSSVSSYSYQTGVILTFPYLSFSISSYAHTHTQKLFPIFLFGIQIFFPNYCYIWNFILFKILWSYFNKEKFLSILINFENNQRVCKIY